MTGSAVLSMNIIIVAPDIGNRLRLHQIIPARRHSCDYAWGTANVITRVRPNQAWNPFMLWKGCTMAICVCRHWQISTLDSRRHVKPASETAHSHPAITWPQSHSPTECSYTLNGLSQMSHTSRKKWTPFHRPVMIPAHASTCVPTNHT